MPEKIRVLFAVSTMGGGGAERQVLSILQHLDRDQFSPGLYLVQRRGELLDQVPEDVPVWAFEDRYSERGWYYPGRIHRQQIQDLVRILGEHSSHLLYERMYFMSLIGAAAARRHPLPRIAVIDSNPRFDLPRTGGRFRFIKRPLLRQSYREATRTVAVSECVRRKTAEYYGLAVESLHTCLNFIEISHIDQLMNEPIPTEWDDDRFHIVAIGRLQQEKGFDLLVEAIHQLVHQRGHARLQLHLLGTGPQEAELREQVSRCGLEQHVQFLGFVANPYPMLKRANLFCLSSLYEGLPTVVLEAMVCRVPILATACDCGPAEILLQGRLGNSSLQEALKHWSRASKLRCVSPNPCANTSSLLANTSSWFMAEKPECGALNCS